MNAFNISKVNAILRRQCRNTKNHNNNSATQKHYQRRARLQRDRARYTCRAKLARKSCVDGSYDFANGICIAAELSQDLPLAIAPPYTTLYLGAQEALPHDQVRMPS